MKSFVAAALALTALSAPVQAETLRISHELGYGGAESLDPISPTPFSQLSQMVFSRLVRQGEQDQAVPDLATEWTASADAKTWTFKLREGVKFHNGADFSADDVVYSLTRIQSETIDSPARAVLEIVESVTALDPQTVQIQLKSAHADFPILLMDYRVRIMNKASCNNEMSKLCESDNGTGPYKVVQLDPLGTTQLTRFDGYWEGPAKIENLDIIAIPDQQARVSAMQAGQIDLLPSVTSQQQALFADSSRYTIQNVPTGRWAGLIMRTDTAPFDNPKVRQALRIFADRDAFGKLVMGENGYIVSCDTPVWSGDQYATEMACAADIDGAKKLLAEAGYPNGIDVTLHYSDVDYGTLRLAEVYQQQAKTAGINVKLALTPADGYWTDTWMVEPFFVTSWFQRQADQVFNEIYRGGAKWNESHWNNAKFDQNLDAARQELDFTKRKAIYRELQQQLFAEGGAFIPFHQNAVRVISAKLSGLAADTEEMAIRFQDLEKN
ncbi:ABC transporter substrate-binding protein [Pasteurella testudinis]|uniref:ABC transporter substrate-binding protein n=1 Tax=Pasteurella testudinis TaxID=761 RepID=UPI004057D1CF